MAAQLHNILGMTHESDLMQSFVRVDLGNDSDADLGKDISRRQEIPKQISAEKLVEEKLERSRSPRPSSQTTPVNKTSFNQLARDMKLKGKKKRKPMKVRMQEECYTDKDRAAAVNMGTRDIKQSLKMKRRQDRTKALQLPEEADPSALLALGKHEMKSGDVNIAITFIKKALELNPDDKTALVARSKCYLLLGQPKLALEDAETALKTDKNYIKAIYQKAESLYHLGDFEHSLMYYHRGLRIRPELEGFRLGIQKTQEAIENTIGAVKKPSKKGAAKKNETQKTIKFEPVKMRPLTAARKKPVDQERRVSRRLLGELCVDKEYLEQLLKDPDLKCPNQDNSDIMTHAMEAIAFLNSRQEFWRQQRPISAAPKRPPRSISATPLPGRVK